MKVADETVLELTRVFDAPPERVFSAWIEREQWQSWIGPEGISCEVPLLEPRVGGRYQINMQLSTGERMPVSGEFRVIDTPRTLSFTWGWDGDPARQSLVTITLRKAGQQTEMTLRQEGLGSIANRDGHAKGWTSALNKLAAYLGR